MIKSLLFLVFSIFLLFVSGSEVIQDPRELYKEVLSEMTLSLALLDSVQLAGDRKLKELNEAMLKYERVLKSDKVVNYFCGSVKRVEGENPGFRMLRIYRRDTRNPFVDKIKGHRMIKPKGVTFPAGTSVDHFAEWSDLMDRDLVHFSAGLNEMEAVITNRGIEKVKKMVIDKYIEQGGVLDKGKICFSKWKIESNSNIICIGEINYKSVFIHLEKIKFTKK